MLWIGLNALAWIHWVGYVGLDGAGLFRLDALKYIGLDCIELIFVLDNLNYIGWYSPTRPDCAVHISK